MENMALKIKLAVLWIFMAVAVISFAFFAIMEPGGLETMISEMQMYGPGMVLFMSLYVWVPMLMAFLSVTLKDSSNRRANIILGIIFTGLNILYFTEQLIQPTLAGILFVGWTVVVSLLIVWYAWKWPKEEA